MPRQKSILFIPEPTQIPPTTPPAHPLPTIEIQATLAQATPVPNSEALTNVIQRVSVLEKDVKELKQVDHTLTILESIKSEVPEAVNKYLGSTLGDTLQKDDVLKFIKVKQEYQDPPAGSDQGTKKRRTGKDAEPSKKSLKSKESDKDKTTSTTSKFGKYVSADKSVYETEHVVQMDVEEPNLKYVANDADEQQAYDIPKIPKKDWFKKSPRPKTLDPNWNTVKTVDDAPKQSWFNKMVQAEKPSLTFDELMSTPIDFLYLL
ncbi:hypothetical protein Tco_0828881 [Tanacetum coccineum]